MTSAAQKYLDEIVEPTIKDFENNPMSVRHAFLACVATFHAVDYAAHPKTKAATLRAQWGKASKDFKIVDWVAHAFKHVATGRRQSPDLRSDEVVTRPPMNWKMWKWDYSHWGDKVGGVTLNRERSVDLLETLKRAVLFIRSEVG